MSNLISNSAAELLRAMNQQDDKKREELAKSINNHSLNAAGCGFIPVPFADMAALTINVWHMYVKINDILGISFKDNALKSIASAAIANISGNILAVGVANILKAIPGANIPALVIAAAANYAICYSSAWVYLQVLTTIAKQQNGKIDLDTISPKTLKRYVKDNKDKQKDIAKEAKTEYAKEHKDDK